MKPTQLNLREPFPRRRFLGAAATAALAADTIPRRLAAAPAPSLPSFDREMAAFMEPRKIPGGALAVVKDGRLVYAKGYGFADREKEIRATARTLFRIASISKPFTAVAVIKLVEEGKLELDAKAFDFIDLEPVVEFGKKPDPRLKRITLRQLLHHTGGWDRDASFDPMFRSDRIAQTVDVDRPADANAVIRYMLGKPLDFDPGQRYAYSNFGYCVLGRIIEKVTGRAYDEFVKSAVLKPMKIEGMRLGRSLAAGQAEGESRYYMPDDRLARSVFPGSPASVPWPYGGFNLEAMDAHGGWLASAVDLARFAAALDRPAKSGVLKSGTARKLYEPPAAPVSRTDDGKVKPYYYGLGWLVRPQRKGKANYWHGGSLPGTNTLLVRRWDGLSWAVLFNQRNRDKKLPDGAIDSALHRAANDVKNWPAGDLFESV